MIQSQWTTEGFMTRYDELLKGAETYMATYLKTEAEHLSLFGFHRYSTYDSFRNSRKGYLLTFKKERTSNNKP